MSEGDQPTRFQRFLECAVEHSDGSPLRVGRWRVATSIQFAILRVRCAPEQNRKFKEPPPVALRQEVGHQMRMEREPIGVDFWVHELIFYPSLDRAAPYP
ncbi:hypothetical protein [Cephaloticoccus primus]|uniref:hypothetical protein n=1 Tax=Cephaloticoccus primus TaxID=1548207 RepID=UPI0012E83B92|nr:hypothetical protein [Cephaloticoccus primus]